MNSQKWLQRKENALCEMKQLNDERKLKIDGLNEEKSIKCNK